MLAKKTQERDPRGRSTDVRDLRRARPAARRRARRASRARWPIAAPTPRATSPTATCTLVHRRLKIIDLSDAGAQPMASDDGDDGRLVFNGEIYNHRELRARAGGARRTLPLAQRHRGDRARLRGVGRRRRRAARRHVRLRAVGRRAPPPARRARPRRQEAALLLARAAASSASRSTITALHASGLPRGRRTPRAADAISPTASCRRRRRCTTACEQLPPAVALVVERRRRAPRIDRYWQPQLRRHATARLATPSRQRRVRALDHRRRRAAPRVGRAARRLPLGRHRLDHRRRPDGARARPGAHLLHRLRRRRALRRDPLRAHRRARLRHRAHRVHAAAVVVRAGRDAGAPPRRAVRRLVGDSHLRRLAADAPARHGRAHRRRRRRALLRLRALPRRRGGRAHPGAAAPAWPRCVGARCRRRPASARCSARARRFLGAGALPLADRMARWNTFFDPRAILRRDVAARSLAVDAPLAWQRAIFAAARGRSRRWRACSSTTSAPTCPTTCWSRPIAASMAHGLEARSPFLDTALIEYAATLPPAYLRRGRDTKRIFKHAFADLLPAGDPHARQDGLRRAARHLVPRRPARLPARPPRAPGARLYDYLDRARRRRRCSTSTQRGARDHGQRLWPLLTLEIWLRSLASAGRARSAAVSPRDARHRRSLRIIDRLNVGGPAIHAVLTTRGLDRDALPHACWSPATIEPGEADMSYLLDEHGVERVAHPVARPRAAAAARSGDRVAALARSSGASGPTSCTRTRPRRAPSAASCALLAGVPVRVHTFHGHVFHGYFGPWKTRALSRHRAHAGARRRRGWWRSRRGARRRAGGALRIAPRDRFTVVPLGFDLAPFAAVEQHRGQLRARARRRRRRARSSASSAAWCRSRTTPPSSPPPRAGRAPRDVHFVFVGGGELEAEVRAAIAPARPRPRARTCSAGRATCSASTPTSTRWRSRR